MKKPIFAPHSRSEVGCNGRIKRYPDGSWELLVSKTPIFGMSGWERVDDEQHRHKEKSSETSEENLDRSVRRARQQIKDYALCSQFKYFVTLTLDKTKVDRYDISLIVKKLNTWLDNRVRRDGLRYILVPERHQDGAIHFHGFFNEVVEVRDSGLYAKLSQKIYNLPKWTFGFSTAIELYGDYEKAVSYVCKYVGKSSEKIGGRWYYSGGSLNKPQVDYVDVPDDIWSDPDGIRFDIASAGLNFVLFKHSPEKSGDVI